MHTKYGQIVVRIITSTNISVQHSITLNPKKKKTQIQQTSIVHKRNTTQHISIDAIKFDLKPRKLNGRKYYITIFEITQSSSGLTMSYIHVFLLCFGMPMNTTLLSFYWRAFEIFTYAFFPRSSY